MATSHWFGPLAAAALLAPAAAAQQFSYVPTALPPQAIWTDGVELVDVDADDDLDILFANGSAYGGTGSQGAQAQHLFLNNGSAVFSAAHANLNVINFNAKMVIAHDFDNDNDPDLMYASGSTGSPPRLLFNNGSGVFTDVTATNIPALALRSFSVAGGDVDSDGDIDVVVSDGGTFGGVASQARLLLNDGDGVFVDVTGTQMPADLYNCQDATLVDFDNDHDLDILLSGKGSGGLQGRLYRNGGLGFFSISTVFNGVGTGATYEVDWADLDGDRDLDGLVQSISGASEGWARNDGTGVAMPEFTFPAPNGNDDNEMAGIDYDNDGDIDVFVASLAGTEKLYRNDLGGTFVSVTAGTIQAQSDASLDVAFGDLNGDGKYDFVTAQGESGNFTNKVYLNSGPSDTRAPTFQTRELPALNGDDVLFRARFQDAIQDDGQVNNYTVTYTYVTVDEGAGSFGSGDAYHMGGGLWSAKVPTTAQTDAVCVTWTAIDDQNNSLQVMASAGGVAPFTDLGFALAGTTGNPSLVGSGTLAAASTVTLSLSNALPNTFGAYVVGVAYSPLPIFGGTLVPSPTLTFPFIVNGSGNNVKNLTWPGFTPCSSIWFQGWMLDNGAVQGFAASNAVRATQP